MKEMEVTICDYNGTNVKLIKVNGDPFILAKDMSEAVSIKLILDNGFAKMKEGVK